MSDARWPRLHELDLPWRAFLTVAVVFIAAGYGAAVLNVYAQNELTDGRPGLTADDLVLKYSGMFVDVAAGEAAPSRMLEMIQGSMRQYFSDDAAFDVMFDWLQSGAARGAFTSRSGPAPDGVLVADCLRCHAEDSGAEIATTSPFGPSMFEASYDMVSKFTLAAAPGETRAWRAPRDWRGLALTTHVHMLSVPVFVMAIGVLFLWAGWPAASGPRALLASAPLVLFLADVACWWLARIPEHGWVFAYTIPITGAMFGPAFALQILVVLAALWRRAPH